MVLLAPAATVHVRLEPNILHAEDFWNVAARGQRQDRCQMRFRRKTLRQFFSFA
jgi:hypothetical protein